jgi:hypothetical protein
MNELRNECLGGTASSSSHQMGVAAAATPPELYAIQLRDYKPPELRKERRAEQIVSG